MLTVHTHPSIEGVSGIASLVETCPSYTDIFTAAYNQMAHQVLGECLKDFEIETDYKIKGDVMYMENSQHSNRPTPINMIVFPTKIQGKNKVALLTFQLPKATDGTRFENYEKNPEESFLDCIEDGTILVKGTIYPSRWDLTEKQKTAWFFSQAGPEN